MGEGTDMMYQGGGGGVAYPGQSAQPGQVFDPSGKYKLLQQGAFAAVEVGITPGDECKSAGGVMITMSNNVGLRAHLDGGCCTALSRCCCGGGSLFLNNYSVRDGGRGDVVVAPAVPGEIVMLELDGTQEWALEKNVYLCSDMGIDIGSKRQNCAQCCCSGEGWFVMKASGRGRVLLSSFGSILKYDLQPGEQRKIDNGFLVAWNIHDYKIVKAGASLAGSVISGEGFATLFTGPGTVYVQTRSLKQFAGQIGRYLAAGGGGGGGGGE